MTWTPRPEAGHNKSVYGKPEFYSEKTVKTVLKEA